MINEPVTKIELKEDARHELGRGIADIIDTVSAKDVLDKKNFDKFVTLAKKTLAKQNIEDPKSIAVLSTDIASHFRKIAILGYKK